MRIVKLFFISVLALVVPTIFANCASPDFSPYLGKNVTNQCIQTTPTPITAHHKKYKKRAVTSYNAVMLPGSLKYNVVQIANQYGWNNVIWQIPDDYNWVGRTRIKANTLTGLFNKILSNYPLQAQFYQGNHVLVIAPRNLP
jgi:hypothetical protein